MKLLKLKNTAILKWAVPVLTALVLAVTFGCSEPRVRRLQGAQWRRCEDY